MTKSFRHWIFWLGFLPAVSLAQTPASEPSYFISDLGDYLSAPARWDGQDWMKFGAITGGLLILSESVDDSWKREMISEEHPGYYDRLTTLGNNWGTLNLAAPFMLGVYGYGYLNNDDEYLNAGYNMFQAGAYAAISTTALKLVFHRDRPNSALDEAGWFKDGKSFPSGHTSFAFAISRSFLNSLDHPSLGTKALFYGLATTTAFARTRDNKHWTSDVVGGALLGIYTADFVDEQHRKRHNNGIAYAPYVDAETVGIQVRW
ncbi:MAG: phosphatase PAP2 family protein [Gammaproteobacteria bacterium]|nr:phosphatase PAP2 family protein [Gammaproteobacteria bacterium]